MSPSYTSPRIRLFISRGFLCLFIPLCSHPGWADTEITTIRENLAKALEYQDQAAREQSDWRMQREEIESLMTLAREEQRALKEKLSAFQAALDGLGEKKGTLQEKLEPRTEIIALLRDRLEPIKEELNLQYLHWPSILQQDTKSDLTVLNNSPLEALTTGNLKALGAALDILKTVGEFQHKINQGYLVREFPDGGEGMFEVIFLGLAQGFYFSEDRGLAGAIVFDGDQWIWKDDRKLLPSLVRFSEMLSGDQQASLIKLPFQLNTGTEGGTE